MKCGGEARGRDSRENMGQEYRLPTAYSQSRSAEFARLWHRDRPVAHTRLAMSGNHVCLDVMVMGLLSCAL